MEPLTHDPYLNTVKRSLRDKRYKELHEKKIKNTNDFLKKRFEITDYINLPEGLASIIFFILFLVIPYIVGISFIFIIIAKASIETFSHINIDGYPVYWSIGYEVIASFLLFIIIKSAISYRGVESLT